MAGGAELRAEGCGGAVGRKERGDGVLFAAEAVHFGEALVSSEKEEAIFADGASDGRAELILLEVRFGLAVELREEIVGVEFVVAYEFPGAAVELIGAAATDEVDVGAAAASVGGIVVRGLHVKFLDGVDSGNGGADFKSLGSGGGIFCEVVGVDAIELEIV